MFDSSLPAGFLCFSEEREIRLQQKFEMRFAMDKPAMIRPKLRHNSVFLRTEDGVFFQSDKALFRLKGKSIARWISTLSPYMNGEHTLEELCHGFEPAQREMLIRLVETLLQRGVLKDAVLEEPGILPDTVRRQFAVQLAYIDHFTEEPQKRFKAFRESRLLLAGSGEALLALALSLLRNGLQELSLAPADGRERYIGVLEPEAARIREGGSEVQLSINEASLSNALERLEDYDMVVYGSDSSSLKEIAALNECCVRAGRPFLSTTVFAGQAMLGPYTGSPTDPCWLCAQLRLSAWRDAEKGAAFWKEVALGDDLTRESDGVFTSIAWRIGHGLGFELFKILSGALPSETQHGVILQDLEILHATSSTLTQHPLCPVCAHNDPVQAQQRLLEIVHGKRDNELLQDEVYKKYTAMFDPQMGAFRKESDPDLQQLPLKVARINMAQTEASSVKHASVTAYAIDNVSSASYAALMQAIKHYATPDRRAMHFASPDEMVAEGHRVLLPQRLATWTGAHSLKANTRVAWLPAFSAQQHALVYVPAAVVYPQSVLNQRGMFEKTAAGLAVAKRFRTVFEEGLFSALGYTHFQEFSRGDAAFARLDPQIISSVDADLAYLVRSAQRFERPFICLEMVHQSPLSVCLVRTTDTSGEHLTTCGVGLSGSEAASMALLNFVGGLQMLQTEGRLPPASDACSSGFSHYRGDLLPTSATSRFLAPAATIGQVEEYLQETGRDALFVDVTPSDIWNKEALISGLVVLTSTR